MENKSYAQRQAEWIMQHGLKKGDKVRVVRKAKDNEDGWLNTWEPRMYDSIGCVHVFDGIYKDFAHVYGLRLRCIINDCIHSFPYFVLEPIVDLKELPQESGKVSYNITVDKEMFPIAPGTKVVVRDDYHRMWRAETFLAFNNNTTYYKFKCYKDIFKYCHPFATHGHLLDSSCSANTPACAKCGKPEPICTCVKEVHFEPFQKVLVRDRERHVWAPAYFSHCDEGEEYGYMVTEGDVGYRYCIPYEGNEDLAATTDSPS